MHDYTVLAEINLSKFLQQKLAKTYNSFHYFKKLVMSQQKPRPLMVYSVKPSSLLAS